MDKTDTAIDPTSMFMHLKLQILDKDGKEIKQKKDEVLVGGTNLLAYSLFSSVEVFISDQKINPGSTYYPWMCYALNLLYQSQDCKKSSLRSAGWFADDAGLFDKVGDDIAKNSGFIERSAIAQHSGVVGMYARVMLDTQFPARVLPVQTEFTLRFNRSDPNLCLMAKSGTYRIKINMAKIYVLKMRLTDQALQHHHNLLSSDGVNFPMVQYDTRTVTMMAGAQNLDWVPISGVMPQKVYVWQTSQKAFNGAIDKNPFNFDTFNVSKVQVLVNERSMITSQPTGFNVSEDRYPLYMNTVLSTTEAPFTPFEFTAGYFIFAVDLTRDHSAGCNYVSDPVSGNLRIMMDYKEPLKESVVVFCMSEFYNTLHLDTNRNPTWIS
jgi:hypothetical protein